MDKLIYLALLSIYFLCVQQSAHAALTGEQEEARSKGMFFYNLKRTTEAMPHLRISAEAGDAESQFALGAIYKEIGRYIFYSEDANEAGEYWYKRAAEQKHMGAMVQLFNTDGAACRVDPDCSSETGHPQTWRELALITAKQRADEGDADAMYHLFIFTDKDEWLIKAAEAGSARAQFNLAKSYHQGKDFFLTPARRQQAVGKWLSAAAEADFIPALHKMRQDAALKNDIEKKLYWTERGAKAGALDAMYEYIPTLDTVRAYGLSLLFIEAVQPSAIEWHSEALKALIQKMTPEQIKAGEAYSEYWRKYQPPLVSIYADDPDYW